MKGRLRIAVACAGLLATSVARAGAQTTFRETGSVTVGGYVVWVRGTSANVVELFVGRGFRDAFAHAHEMDAAKLQHWIDSVRAIAPLPADDSSAIDARARGSLIGSDVTMMRRMGGSFSGLRLLVSGEDPITMAEPTARDFIAVLDSAAHASRDLSQPATAVVAMSAQAPAPAASPTPAPMSTPISTPIAAPTPPAPTPPAPTPPAPTPPAPVTVSTPTIATPPVAVPPSPAPVAATPSPAPAPAPAPAPSPATPAVAVASASPPAPATPLIGVAPVSPEASPLVPPGPSTAEAPPELVLPAPSEPVILLASRVDIMPLPLPPPAIPPAPPPPAPDTLIPPHPDAPADKLIHTPLGPFTIPGALLADRDKEAQYCYTQLGLKYNPDLKGEITVKVSVSSNGAVQDAVVTKRSWQGISAGEVESCVRALAHDWTFPSSDPSITGGAKLLTFSFAP